MTSRLQQPYIIYLVLVATTGFILVGYGINSLFSAPNILNFVLLLILAFTIGLLETSTQAFDKANVVYQVNTAVTLAAIPFYGPGGAAVIAAVSNFLLWFIKRVDKKARKRSMSRVLFNMGMDSIALFSAGLIFTLLQGWLGAEPLLGMIIPWFVAAIVYEQVNMLLLIGILYLQHDRKLDPWKIWWEHRWLSFLSVIIYSIGAAVLAFGVERFDWIGIIIFFLPILLSAFALRIYIHRIQAHMDSLESIVAERTQELAKLIKDKDTFLAVLSHDMKSPLTAINIYASLIRKNPQMASEKPELVDAILRSQKALTEIVDNILDFEKMQTEGSVLMEKENLDLVDLVKTTVASLRAQVEEKEIDLRFEAGKEPLFITVDGDQIKRVIQNLVSNAIKYTPNTGHIFIRTYAEENFLVTEVEDDGYGIPDEELPFIFDRYHRVAEHKDVAAGTGLGLAIVKAIVEAHDGVVSVTHREGGGSIFQFGLPT